MLGLEVETQGHWERISSSHIYVKPRPNSTHIVEYTSLAEMLRFVVFVCLSVCQTPHIPFVYSVLERRRKFIFFEELTTRT